MKRLSLWGGLAETETESHAIEPAQELWGAAWTTF